MVARLEVELRRLADVAQHDGVFLAAVGHVGERDVGDLQQHSLSCSRPRRARLELLDLVAQLPHGGDLVGGVAAGPLDWRSRRWPLAHGAPLLDLGGQPPALLFDGEELVERRRAAAPLQRPADLVGLRTHHLDVEHRLSSRCRHSYRIRARLMRRGRRAETDGAGDARAASDRAGGSRRPPPGRVSRRPCRRAP